MERYKYIDSLRGFAILVVVIGHCCEFGLGKNDGLFNSLYYSFHMPLFMFISGLVAYKRPNYKFGQYIKSKSYRLLIPFLVIGSVACFARGIPLYYFFYDFAKKGYWFLPVLFFILLLMFPAYKINTLINRDNRLWKEICIFIIPLFISMICYKMLPSNIVRLFSVKYIVKLYPFVFMGMLFAKYETINRFINKDLILLALILLTIVSFVFIYRINGAISIVGYFFVPIIYLMFKNNIYIGDNSTFIKLGGRSLQIYMLHYFFIPSVRYISDVIDSQYGLWTNNGNFILYGVISLVIAFFVIICTLLVIKVVEMSPTLNFLLFGIRHNSSKIN